MNTPAPLPAVAASWLWLDGSFVACDSLPLWDRGFRYGMALFETVAVRGGRPLFLREHLANLAAACRQVGWTLPTTVDSTHPPQNQVPPIDGVLRLYCTAGPGAPGAPVTQPGLYCLWEPQQLALKQEYRLAIHPAPFQPLFQGLKTANYWANIEALSNAQAQGHDEALLFSSEGLLISAAMANVFVLINGQLHTPDHRLGARQGVVRQWVLSQRPVQLSPLTRSDLEAADELFLTNSRIGIMPVAQLAERRIPNRLIATALRHEYERAIAN